MKVQVTEIHFPFTLSNIISCIKKNTALSVQLLKGSTLIWRMVVLLWPVPTAGFWLLLSVRHHYISSIHPRHQIYSIDIDNTQTGSRHNTHIRCMNPNRGLFYNSIFLSKPITFGGGMMHNSISTSSFSLRPGGALYLFTSTKSTTECYKYY